jgi:hypothetical protein
MSPKAIIWDEAPMDYDKGDYLKSQEEILKAYFKCKFCNNPADKCKCHKLYEKKKK